MKHRPRPEEQDDLLRPRLVDMIDHRHELVKLAALIDWDVFDREWAGFFPSGKGRPATEPRLVAGLLYLQHAYRLSDEAVVARWVENPYYQHLTGETFFQHKLPIDRRCCKTLSPKDSHRESMRLDGAHEQAITRLLPHDELVQLHGVSAQARIPADLAGQGHVLACAA